MKVVVSRAKEQSVNKRFYNNDVIGVASAIVPESVAKLVKNFRSATK